MANRADLVLRGEVFTVPCSDLLMRCRLFRNSSLLVAPYEIRSRVAPESLRAFIAAVRGVPPAITSRNVLDLADLAEEFDFVALAELVRNALEKKGPADVPLRSAIKELKELRDDQKREITALEGQIGDLKAELVQLKLGIERLVRGAPPAARRRSHRG
jgi:hypothetical protein